MLSTRAAPIAPIVAARMSVKPLDAETTEVSAAELVPLIIPALPVLPEDTSNESELLISTTKGW